jgi:serine/threonine-protein kinase
MGLLAGRYRLGEVLGEGPAGTVHAARDELLDRQVAVKVLDRLGDGVGVRRALRAARTALAVESPHVVALLDLGEADPPLLVMERLNARPLPAVLAEGPLPGDEVRRISDAVLSAVATLHAEGVVHRDVRPDNVLVTTGGRVALTAVGLAEAALDGALGVRFTAEPPRPFPAPSPEQAESQPADARSDVFALAVLLTALGRDTITAAEAAVLHQATALDPLERHPSAEALRDDLRRARRPARPARRAGAVAAAPERLQTPRGNRRLRLTIGGVAAASLLTGSFLAARGAVVAEAGRPPAAVRATESSLDGLAALLERDPGLVGPSGADFAARLDRLRELEGEQRAREAADLVAIADLGKASGAFDPAFAEAAAAVLAQEAASATAGASASAQNP